MVVTKEETQKFADIHNLSFEVANCVILCADTMSEAIEEVKTFDASDEEIEVL